MSETYEINEYDQVVPYSDGRKCNDTRAYRDATDLEMSQREEISELEKQIEALEDVDDIAGSYRDLAAKAIEALSGYSFRDDFRKEFDELQKEFEEIKNA